MTSNDEQQDWQTLPAELERLTALLEGTQQQCRAADQRTVELELRNRELQDQLSTAKQTAEQYSGLYHATPLVCVSLSPAGVIEDVNLAGADFLGTSRRLLIGKPFRLMLVEQHRQGFLDLLRACRHSPQPQRMETLLRRREGTKLPVEIYAVGSPLASGDEEVRLWIVDLSVRRQTEQDLRDQQEILDLALASSGAGVWNWNCESGQMTWSMGLCALFGRPGSFSPTLDAWLGLIHLDDQQTAREGFQKLQRGAADVRFEFRVSLPSGVIRWFGIRGRSFAADAGTARQAVGVVTDISGLKDTQESLSRLNRQLDQQSQRADARGAQVRKLAAELTQAEQRERQRLARVLHDHLQQWLVAAKMQVGMLRSADTKNEREEIATKLESILIQSLAASRSLSVDLHPPVLHECGLAAALAWLGRHVQEQHGLHVEIEADEADDPSDEAVRVTLFEAVRELLLNVVKHAQTDRARVTLATDGDAARVIVSDRGIGMPGDFHPGTSSNAPTGFGLSSVQHRIEVMGGEVEIASQPGEGTTVMLTVPCDELVIEPEAEEPRETVAAENGQVERIWLTEPSADGKVEFGSTIRVLLADDHQVVREGLAKILQQQADFELVGQARDGHEVIELARRLRPNVVIMDVNMPQMNGLAATHHITVEMPEVRVVGLSLHEDDEVAIAMRTAGAAAFLTKTSPSEELCRMIRLICQYDDKGISSEMQ